MTPTITVGQAVAVRSAYGYNNYIFGYTVSKVTPKGQVVVKREDGHEMRFDAQGYQMGNHSLLRRAQLIPNVEAAREDVRQQKACNEAAAAINAVRTDVRSTYGKDALVAAVAELETKLAAARAAVEAI